MHHRWQIPVLPALVAMTLLAPSVQARAAESAKNVNEAAASTAAVRAAFALPDAIGGKHSPDEWHGKKAVLVFFIAAECPVSNFYSPDFTRIANEYAEKGIVTYGVHCDEDLSGAAAASHAKEYGLKFPVLLDPKLKLAAAVGARTTPEAFLLSPDGSVLYHGRIDDRFAVNGKRRDEPSKHELEDALRAVVAGKKPAVAESKPYGCPLPRRENHQTH
jgi:peroxiredoxin